jgi:uncharacterized protein YjbI with pentapeptide repeats
MADNKIDSFDIGALEKAVNDSAGRVSGIWLSFVAFSAYLAAAASMISHRQMFLEEPIKLPTINIDLPLVASAILLPLLFVIYHIFVLLQVVLLARTADAYNDAVEHNVTEATDRIRVRQRLANTLFAQLFAGSPREREGVLGWLLRLMAWVTLAIAPICVLLVFEIKFLPYHSAAVTWTHRGLIVVDLLAILLLWAGAVDPRRDISFQGLMKSWKVALVAALIAILSNVLVTFPGEPGRFWMKFLASSVQSESDVRECQVAWMVGAVVAPSFDRFVLLGEDFVDDEKLGKITATAKTNEQQPYESERTRIFRGRDLRCGRFAGADLRHVDFAESDLSGAVLRGAHLEGTTFGGARLTGTVLDSAQLQDSSFAARQVADKQLGEAQLPNSSLRGAQLQRANLEGVNFEGSDLWRAQLQEANLDRANLRGASLKNAILRDASLDGARLQGASLQSASMQRTSLNSAEMQGAVLTGARMTGASLDNAKLHGAVLYETQLRGASFNRTEFHGAVFRSAKLEGAAFIEAQLQGTQFPETDLRYVVVSDSLLWQAGSIHCNYTHVSTPNFEAIIDLTSLRGKPVPIAANATEIASFIKRSLADVPDKSRVVTEFSKANLERDLNTRLRAPSPNGETSGEKDWRDCAAESQARTPEKFQELASRIVEYVCGSVPNPNQIVEAVVAGWTAGNLSDTPVAKTFATLLLAENNVKCPRAKTLADDTKQRLRDVVNPQAE